MTRYSRFIVLRDTTTTPPQTHAAPIFTTFVTFLGIGLRGFGGPAAQLSVLSSEFVEKRAWLPLERFRRALAVCQVIPGPEAHEMCCYIGVVRAGSLGGIAAGLGFMLPGLVLMLAASALYTSVDLANPMIAGALHAMQLAASALIVRATWKLATTLARGKLLATVFVAAALAVFAKQYFSAPTAVIEGGAVQTVSVAALFGHGLMAGLVTFGGAYTAIPYVATVACGPTGWMTERAFLDGIAISGVLPAPLVIFGTFVGWQGAGLAGALAFTAGIFLPAFTFVIAGFRVLDRLVAWHAARVVLDVAGAAAAGVIAATALGLASRSIGVHALVNGDANWTRTMLHALVFAALVLWFFRAKHRASIPAAMIAAALVGSAIGAFAA
jgi:chromate transporter